MKYLLALCICMATEIVFGQDCAKTYTNLIPITDLGKDTFEGFTGGKYPGGNNAIPLNHYRKGMEMAHEIQPLNANGSVDMENGKIGFLILGYSTAAMTARYFRFITNIKNINFDVHIIIGAQGGKDINSMLDASGKYYTNVDSTCRAQQITFSQIEVIWLSSGDILSFTESFPQQCYTQVDKYHQMLLAVKTLFPNIKIVFISDRPYAGYIGDTGPQDLKEPSAYYNSWTVKWLIEKQIMHTEGYSYNDMPFIDWGPTLWTDGEKGNLAGYTWQCADAGKGGIHASERGRAKESARLYLFFTSHPYSQDWFYEAN